MKFLPGGRTGICLFVVLFLLAATGWASSTLYFPRISAAGVHGLAFFNPGDGTEPAGADAEIALALYDQNGNLVQGAGITNPAQLVVPSGQNTAVTVQEVFGLIGASVTGWIEATSPVDNLTGFFLFLSSDQSKLDGADQPPVGRRLVFNDVRGSEEFRTEINVFNTGGVTQMTFALLTPQGAFFRTVGEPPAEGFSPTFPARGLLRIDNCAEFFGLNSVPPNSYLEVLSETQIGGFQFLWSSDGDLLGLNARKRSEWLKTISFPQLAVGGPWKMEVNIVNYSLQQVRLLFYAGRPDGQPYAPPDVTQNPAVRLLDPDSAMTEDVAQLFGFEEEGGPFEGSLRVESYRVVPAPLGVVQGGSEPYAAVNGSVRYGVLASGSEAAVAAPLEARQKVIFSHLATIEGFFTGFAAYNSSSAASDLRLMAFREDGTELGLFDTILRPGERIAKLITEILPAAADQNGGYLWAESSQPLYYSSLFGSSDATLLANVPPQPVPESFLPDAAKPDFRIEPHIEPVALEREADFVVAGAVAPTWSVEGVSGGTPSVGEIDASGHYQAPAAFPEPEGPLTVAAAEGELIAAATVDLLKEDVFTQTPVSGTLNQIAYAAGVDELFGIIASGGGVAAGEEIVSSLIEIEPAAQTLVLDLPGEEISDILPFEGAGGQQFLLLSSRTTNRILRVDPETSVIEAVVEGLNVPQAMAWEPLGGSLLVGDASSVQSVSRSRLDSDLVSGTPGNGRPPVTLTAVENLLGLATDGCTGRIFWTDSEGRIEGFDPFTRSIETVVGSLSSPQGLLAVYRRNGDCRAALRLLTTQAGSGEISLVDPSDASMVPLAQVGDPADFSFVETGLGLTDTLLLVDRSPSPAGSEPESQIFTVRSPRQHQSYAPDAVGLAIPGSAADLLGDTFGGGETQVDALELSAFHDESSLYVTVSFADAIQPCDEQCQQGASAPRLLGALDMDLDRNPATGAMGLVELNSFSDSGLGIEAFAFFNFYDEQAGGLPVFVLVDEVFEEAGRVPVTFGTHDLSFSIPLSMIGGHGEMRLAGVFGPADGASDAVPDAGFVESIELDSAPFSGGQGAIAAVTRSSLPCGWKSGSWKGPTCQSPAASSESQ